MVIYTTIEMVNLIRLKHSIGCAFFTVSPMSPRRSSPRIALCLSSIRNPTLLHAPCPLPYAFLPISAQAAFG